MLLKPCVLSGVESEGEAVSGCWALVWVLPQGPVRVQQTKTREMGPEAQSPESGLMFNRDNMEWWERKIWARLRVQWLASLGLGVWFLKRVPGRKNVNLAFFRTTSCLRLKGSWGAWGLHLLSWTDFKNKQLGALVLFLVVWLCPVQHYVLACWRPRITLRPSQNLPFSTLGSLCMSYSGANLCPSDSCSAWGLC